MRWLVILLFLASCSTSSVEYPPLGKILLRHVKCSNIVSCHSKAVLECPLGYEVKSYTKGELYFWCS